MSACKINYNIWGVTKTSEIGMRTKTLKIKIKKNIHLKKIE
jgi:hypothetical protein